MRNLLAPLPPFLVSAKRSTSKTFSLAWSKTKFTAEVLGPSTILAGVFQVGFLLVFGYFWFHIPIPGVSVAILGLAAAIMAARGESLTKIEKIIWVIIAFALCGVEIRSIQRDRDDQNKQHIADLTRQEAEFKSSLVRLFNIDTRIEHLQLATDRLDKEISTARMEAHMQPSLKLRTLEMAREITEFVSMRTETAPVRPDDRGPNPNAYFAFKAYQQQHELYEAQVRDEWKSRFLARISALTDELQAKGVTLESSATCMADFPDANLRLRNVCAESIENAAKKLK